MNHTEKLAVARLLKAIAVMYDPGPAPTDKASNETREAINGLLPYVKGYDTDAPQYGVDVGEQ